MLALVLAWFALVRPAIQSAATEAAEDKAQEIAKAAGQQPGGGGGGQPPGGGGGGGGAPSSQSPSISTPAPGPQQPTGLGQQSSATIEVRTNPGGRGTSAYEVPDGKIFRITDILLANPQGDEGVLTIVFGDRTITRIALETFRNQDYHWVTPIEVPAGATVDATVTCSRPGTPATGVQARSCLQLLNVSGELVDQPQ